MNGFEFKEIANSFKSLADKLPDFSNSESKGFPLGKKNLEAKRSFQILLGKKN